MSVLSTAIKGNCTVAEPPRTSSADGKDVQGANEEGRVVNRRIRPLQLVQAGAEGDANEALHGMGNESQQHACVTQDYTRAVSDTALAQQVAKGISTVRSKAGDATHKDVDDAEDYDGPVAAPVAVCNVGSQQREEVARAAPIGDLHTKGKPLLSLPSQAIPALPLPPHCAEDVLASGALRLCMRS